jgi:hypothetical protein
MPLKNLLRWRAAAPPAKDVSSAMRRLLSQSGTRTGPMLISAVKGTSKPIYHVLPPLRHAQAASKLLSTELSRPFPADHPGWLIDLQEARTLIEAAHRIIKDRKA